MIKKLLLNDILRIVKNREKRLKELKEEKDFSDPSVKKEVMVQLHKEGLPVLYLEEDCSLLNGGGFKRGKQLVADDVKRLYQLGFQTIWVTDKPISEEDKKKDLNYYAKTEIENVLNRCMILMDESEGKKSATSIKILNGDDLLRQTIEPLQYDGARYLYNNIIGSQHKKLLPFLSVLKKILSKQLLKKFTISEALTIGNIVQVREHRRKAKEESEKNGENKDDKKDKEEKIIKSNFIIKQMVNIGFAYLVTLTNINRKRLERFEEIDGKKIDYDKRLPYEFEQLYDCVLGSFMMDIGFLHSIIEKKILSNTFSFFDSQGQETGDGWVDLDDSTNLILYKHCNVSYHFFAWMKEKALIKESGLEVIQYHQRGINGYGYPKRKTIEEKVQFKDKHGNIGETMETVFDHELPEHVRLAVIVSFFVAHLFPMPFHLGFERDNLCRHMLLNSEWVLKPNSEEIDTEGIWELKSRKMYDKRFDGFLVEQFLKSINVFKIGEHVPIYTFKDSTKIVFHGIVKKYNEMPHRPIVEVVKDGKRVALDLSNPKFDKFYIGEYVKSLKFQDVIDEFHEDSEDIKGGVLLSDMKGYELAKGLRKPTEKEKIEAEVEDLFSEPKKEKLDEKPAEDVNVDDLISSFIPKELQNKKDK